MDGRRNNRGTIGNQGGRSEIHGARGALQRIEKNLPFIGEGAIVEQQVRDRVETEGIAQMIFEGAIRHETVATMYYALFMDAHNRGDLTAGKEYANKFGWQQAAALRAWVQVSELQKASGETLDEMLRPRKVIDNGSD